MDSGFWIRAFRLASLRQLRWPRGANDAAHRAEVRAARLPAAAAAPRAQSLVRASDNSVVSLSRPGVSRLWLSPALTCRFLFPLTRDPCASNLLRRRGPRGGRYLKETAESERAEFFEFLRRKFGSVVRGWLRAASTLETLKPCSNETKSFPITLQKTFTALRRSAK